jgi:hypothetical protein
MIHLSTTAKSAGDVTSATIGVEKTHSPLKKPAP